MNNSSVDELRNKLQNLSNDCKNHGNNLAIFKNRASSLTRRIDVITQATFQLMKSESAPPDMNMNCVSFIALLEDILTGFRNMTFKDGVATKSTIFYLARFGADNRRFLEWNQRLNFVMNWPGFSERIPPAVFDLDQDKQDLLNDINYLRDNLASLIGDEMYFEEIKSALLKSEILGDAQTQTQTTSSLICEQNFDFSLIHLDCILGVGAFGEGFLF
jgi:hypothetical protein